MTSGSRMFSFVTETWNPVTGCPHNCIYCWARRLAETRLRHLERYKDGFKSRLNEDEFRRKFGNGYVFVSDMGDMFADTVPDGWIIRVIDYIKRFSDPTFLFLTKNPRRYRNFLHMLPDNVMLGATIETDDDRVYRGISRAPPPSERIREMTELNWHLLFVSIEPIMRFTPSFPEKIEGIKPSMVYVGYDNYNNKLPEPSLEETRWLISRISRRIPVNIKTIRPAWWER